MTLTFGITKVGRGVALCLLGVAVVSPVSAAEDAAKDKTKGVVQVTGEGQAGSRPVTRPLNERFQLGIGVGFFTESTERRREQWVGGQQTRIPDPEEFESDSIYNIQAWYLQPFWVRGLRVGGGVAWFNEYALEAPDAEEDDEPIVMGQFFQLGLQTEYEVNVVSKLGVVLGLRGGGALLFPSGDLREDIEGFERSGFDVWGSPQFGLYVAPLAGVRWPLSERVSLRSDLSVQFSKLWLYSAEGESAGITSEDSASLGTTRTQFLIGLDFGL
jgi:hypothetical protein